MKYAAFISYDHSDEKIARRIHNALETYPLPKGIDRSQRQKLSPIFRDITELTAHHSLSEKIQEAVQNSQYLIVLCSPSSRASHWVNEEIRLFRQLHGESSILCALIEGTPSTSFPPALIEGGREPLAADMRGQKESFKFGITQMAASMLGVGLDDLIQRETQRYRRRVMAITALSAIGMAVMGALTWTAMDARQEAEQRRNDAEEQIEFMITDLKDKLDEVGRLDALNIVGERASNYYDNYAISDHDDDALGRRARVFHLLGEVQDKYGNLPEAENYFKQAYSATETLLTRNPNDPDRVFEHAQSAFWMGDLNYHQENYDDAKTYYTIYLEQALKLEELEPTSLRSQQELSYAFTNMGLVTLELGHIDVAQRHYESAIAYKQALTEKHPEKLKPVLSLSGAYAHLANIHLRQDNITQAIRNWEQADQVLLDMKQSSDARLLYQRLAHQRALGRLYLLADDPQKTQSSIAKGLALADKLQSVAPDSIDVIYKKISLHIISFDLAFMSGDIEIARQSHQAVEQSLLAVPRSAHNDYRYQSLRSVGDDLPIYLALMEKDWDKAQSLTLGRQKTLKGQIKTVKDVSNNLYNLGGLILVNQIMEDSYSENLLAEFCTVNTPTLDFYIKIALLTKFSMTECPNAETEKNFPPSKLQTSKNIIDIIRRDL